MTVYFTATPVAAHTRIRAAEFNALQTALADAFAALPDLTTLRAGKLISCADSGAANAYVLAPYVGGLTAYVEGVTLGFMADNANTGASSVNVSGLGAVALKRYDGSQLEAGDIVAGQPVLIGHNGTNFRLMSHHGASEAIATAAATAAAAANVSAAAHDAAAAVSATNAAASAASINSGATVQLGALGLGVAAGAYKLNVTGNANITGNATITGIAAIHTAIGGWASNANLEVLSGNGIALSGYENGTGDAVRARVDNTAAKLASFYYATGNVGSITTNGTATAYNTSSDERLKTNITDAPDCGAVIDGLRVRSWDWKVNGSHEQFGFVAQEMVIVAPFAVNAGDSDDPVEITRQWGRDDSKLMPLVIKELQTLRVRLAALEGP